MVAGRRWYVFERITQQFGAPRQHNNISDTFVVNTH